jgi:hypothetical protein
MPSITHDSTFAMRVAKAKKLVRYDSTVCPKCSAIIPNEERVSIADIDFDWL